MAVAKIATKAATVRRGAVPPGYVHLTCDNPALDLYVLLGEDAPRLNGGLAKWDVVERPRETSMTLWQGVDPFELALSLMFDDFARGGSQEAALRDLVRVARGDDESAPGLVAVDGLPLLPTNTAWIVTGIDYADAILDARTMQRLRQPVTLTLTEYVPPELLARKRRSVKASTAKVVTVRSQAGDTPAKIAKRRHISSWTTLRDLNKRLITKANPKLKTGTPVRVPAAHPAAPKAKHKGKGK